MKGEGGRASRTRPLATSPRHHHTTCPRQLERKWNAATDELIDVVGPDEINRSTPPHLAVNGLGLHAAAGLAAADRAWPDDQRCGRPSPRPPRDPLRSGRRP